jgi:hypothetical protein
MNPPAVCQDKALCLPVVQVSDIPLEPRPRRWLVEGLWGASAVGFIGGPAKSCKSFLGLELAVAVASAPMPGRLAIEAQPRRSRSHSLRDDGNGTPRGPRISPRRVGQR